MTGERTLTDAELEAIADLVAARLRKPGERWLTVEQVAEEHVLSHPCGPDEPVFRTRNGRRQTPDNIRSRILAPAVARANELLAADNLPEIQTCTPHTLRRTFASLCAEVGLAPRRCMRLMGHTDPNFTMSVYQHVLDMTAGAQEIFETVTGASFQEAFAILSERELPTIY